MRDKIAKWMSGRNGMDELARAESIMVLVPLLLSLFVRQWLINLILMALVVGLWVHIYFRVFSKNVTKRYEENQKFLNARYQMTVKWNRKKKHFEQRKTHCFFYCPNCKQEVRVPKGHGRICITCPKCRTEFIKKS